MQVKPNVNKALRAFPSVSMPDVSKRILAFSGVSMRCLTFLCFGRHSPDLHLHLPCGSVRREVPMCASANEEFGTLADNTPLTGYEPNLIDNYQISETTEIFIQESSSDRP